MKQIFAIYGNKIFVNGTQIDPPSSMSGGLNITQHNNKLYVNGFEWVDGKWRRTIAAIWHSLFN